MSRVKTALIIVFAVIFIGILGTVAVLTAQRQNTTRPVAPTVPQITPRASEPTTTAACTATFTVAAPTHKECKNNACATISGAGQDACTLDSQCAATYTYKTCESNACKEKDCNPKTTNCSNLSTCSSDADCKTYTYRSCENNACVSRNCNPSNKPCDNLISCQTDFDCRATTYKHNVCLGSACSPVQCSPSTAPCADSCSTNSDCGAVTPSTHRECRNNACVSVSGAGADTCSSDVSCQPKAVAPPIPRSGSTEITIGAIILGGGAIILGLLLAL